MGYRLPRKWAGFNRLILVSSRVPYGKSGVRAEKACHLTPVLFLDRLDPLGLLLLLGDPILGRALLLQDQIVAMGRDAVKPGEGTARACRD
jgi:hypothetical protein